MPRIQMKAEKAELEAKSIKTSKTPKTSLHLSICGANTANIQRLVQHLIRESVIENSPSKITMAQTCDALNNRSASIYSVFHTETRCIHLRHTPVDDFEHFVLLNTTADADLVIFLIDANADASNELIRQARRLSILGIKHALLAIDIDDPAPYDQATFVKNSQYLVSLIKPLHFTTLDSMPLSSLTGDNLQASSNNLPWYQGPSLYSWLDNIEISAPQAERVVFTLDRIVHTDDSTFCIGHLVEGRLQIGDVIRLTRTGQTARIVKMLTPNGEVTTATPKTALSLFLDLALNTTQNDILSLAQLPLETTDHFEATLVWLDSRAGLTGRNYNIQLANQQTTCTITNLKYRINLDSGTHEAHTKMGRDDISLCTIATTQALAFDAYTESKTLGSFRLLDKQSEAILAFGMITHSLRRAQNVHAQALSIRATDRAQLNGHKGKVIWFTGLSGSGKSTIANALEVELHGLGYHTYLLDGDNVRQGLNKDLGFTDADRVENIRRIAEVANLMRDAGLIVMTAFISPFRQERQMARELIGESSFIEVYVSTSLEICEQRDVKGLYKKARAGQLPNLSGIGSAYEVPLSADVVINTDKNEINSIVKKIIDKI
jgi:bifunctional enzyme CysN/CysC